MSKDVIWIVVNSEDTEPQATRRNAEGCRALCDARIEAQADMLYQSLAQQARELTKGSRIVMHQGGGQRFRDRVGAAQFVAAGYVHENARMLTPHDVSEYRALWNATKSWYQHWPQNPELLRGQLLILYRLKRAMNPMPRPNVIRPTRGHKYIPLHPNCTRHARCAAYPHVDSWWHEVMSQD